MIIIACVVNVCRQLMTSLYIIVSYRRRACTDCSRLCRIDDSFLASEIELDVGAWKKIREIFQNYDEIFQCSPHPRRLSDVSRYLCRPHCSMRSRPVALLLQALESGVFRMFSGSFSRDFQNLLFSGKTYRLLDFRC